MRIPWGFARFVVVSALVVCCVFYMMPDFVADERKVFAAQGERLMHALHERDSAQRFVMPPSAPPPPLAPNNMPVADVAPAEENAVVVPDTPPPPTHHDQPQPPPAAPAVAVVDPPPAESHEDHRHGDWDPSVATISNCITRHVFAESCGGKVAAGKQSKKFPNHPDLRDTMPSFESVIEGDSYFQRLFGLLIAPTTGDYYFAVASDDHSELWLSTDEDPAHEKRIAYLGKVDDKEGMQWTDRNAFDTAGFPSIRSGPVRLEAGKRYFIEGLHKQGSNGAHFSAGWKTPGAAKFAVIPGSALLGIRDASKDGQASASELQRMLQGVPAHDTSNVPNLYPFIHFEPDERENLQRIPWASPFPESTLPNCPYNPSYLLHRKMSLYSGIQHVFESYVWPADQTDKLYQLTQRQTGNKAAPEQLARGAAERVAASLPGYTLDHILNVDLKSRGGMSRLLVDIAVRKTGSATLERYSRYVIAPAGNVNSLCMPKEFQWSQDAIVYVVIPVKNQGKWVRFYADNMAAIAKETGDHTGVHSVIVDYASDDVDVDAVLKASGIAYTLVRLTGKFSRAGGLQAGIDAVPDSPRSLVFACDLHLAMPPSLFDMVRTHTVLGLQAFAPVLVRLECGMQPSEPNGFWETGGYGLIALYKSDWSKIGGMNTQQFKDKWGGEDWECVDRVIGNGYEIERLRIFKLYHHYHSHRDMWGAKPKR